MEQPNSDSADALKALAAGQTPPGAERTAGDAELEAALAGAATPEKDAQSALEAMAAGEDVGFDAAPSPQAQPASSYAPEGDTEPAYPDGYVPPPQATPQQMAATRQKLQAKANLAHAHHFKKTTMPLLLVVGIILILMGGAVLFLDQTGRISIKGVVDRGPMRTLLILSAFPLGAILLVGAWMFHSDVTRAEKRNRKS